MDRLHERLTLRYVRFASAYARKLTLLVSSGGLLPLRNRSGSVVLQPEYLSAGGSFMLFVLVFIITLLTSISNVVAARRFAIARTDAALPKKYDDGDDDGL